MCTLSVIRNGLWDDGDMVENVYVWCVALILRCHFSRWYNGTSRDSTLHKEMVTSTYIHQPYNVFETNKCMMCKLNFAMSFFKYKILTLALIYRCRMMMYTYYLYFYVIFLDKAGLIHARKYRRILQVY